MSNGSEMQVPEGWKWCKLGELFSIVIGGTPSRSNDEYWDYDKKTLNKWVSIKDLSGRYIKETAEYISDKGVNNSNVKPIPIGTVMMSFKLTVGRVAYAGTDLYTNEAISSFFPKESNDKSSEFLYHGLQQWNLLENVDQAVKGVTLNKEKLFNIEGLFPPLPEQKKIASILTSVDDVIEKTEAQISKLQDLKKGMMTELLTKGIGHTEFRECPKWGIGKYVNKYIPKGWDLVELSSVAKLESGHTPSRNVPEYWSGSIQWLSLHDTKKLDQREVCKTTYAVTEDGLNNSSARLLPAGTVALSRTASVGNCVILGCDMATSQDFANYVCGLSLHNKYLLYLFRWMQHIWRRLSGGSTHQTVYMPDFKKLMILLPPLEEQIQIASTLDTIEDYLIEKNKKLLSLQMLKKALMNDLLTGKVRVKTTTTTN